MRASTALLALFSLSEASQIWRPERPRDASRRLTQLRGGADEPPPSELAQKFSSWWAKSSAAALSGGSSDDPDVKKAADLMKKRGLDNVNKAVALLRGAHKRNPDDLAIGVDLADALNAVMRIKTNANTILIDGTLDTPANKKIWKELGGEALPLAKAAYKESPNDVRCLAVYADSYMFEASSKGIMKQALSGAGKEFKRFANEFRSKHPKWDSGVGCAFLGGLYQVAPWPVGNKEKAKQIFLEGVKVAASRRNLYYVAVNAYTLGEYESAASYFERALKAPCGSPTEEDFADFMLQESKRGLKAAQDELAKASS